MNSHPSFTELIEASTSPAVKSHVAGCAPCRARSRLFSNLDSEDPESLPGIADARRGMAEARLRAGSTLSASLVALTTDAERSDDLPTGTVVERYTVEALAGRGGVGTVYRVRHNQLGGNHALKVLHHTSRSVRSRLLREGRAQSRLNHPNVVPVTDVVDVDGAPGLIMAWIEGPTLAALLREQHPLGLAQLDRLAQGILRGVAEAHAAGIIHRDLKPGNVLIDDSTDGLTARVSDFGLARLIGAEAAGDTQITRENMALGTPAYMAPEQIRDATRADVRSDIFALGCVLYELLTGRQAFGAPDILAIFDRIRAGDYPPIDRDVPERMSRAVARALQPDPAARFPDCEALLSAWRGESVTDLPAPSADTLADQKPDDSYVAIFTIPTPVFALVAVTLGALGLFLWSKQTPTEPVVAIAVAPPTPPAERRLTALPDEYQIFAIAVSPDGSAMVYSDVRGLWHQSLDQGEPTQLLVGEPFPHLDYFPDGEHVLATGGLDSAYGSWRVNVETGEHELLFQESWPALRLSPDGTRVVYTDSSGLWMMALDGTERLRLRPLASADSTSSLAFSPDGRFVAAIHQSATGKGAWLEITAVDGGSTRRVVEDRQLISLGLAPLSWLPGDRLLYGLTETDTEPSTRLFALDNASSATPSAPELLHTWRGFHVTHLRSSADGRRTVYSRVAGQMETWLVDLEAPGDATPLSREGWLEIPSGWTPDGALVVYSDRGGHGLYRRSLDGVESEKLMDAHMFKGTADWLGDELITITGELDPETRKKDLRVVRAPAGGEPIELLRFDTEVGGSHAQNELYAVRCRSADRCLLSQPAADGLYFTWMDARTGALGETLLKIPVNSRNLTWDLSPDETRLAVLTAEPGMLTTHDLVRGGSTQRPLEMNLPQSIRWAPDGETLYIAGCIEPSDKPYQVFALRPDAPPETLWWSSSWYLFSPTPSPDGRHLAVGAYTFDDDVWLLEGLPEPEGAAPGDGPL